MVDSYICIIGKISCAVAIGMFGLMIFAILFSLLTKALIEIWKSDFF